MINREILGRWFAGNDAAVEFVELAWDAAQIWDDLVDEGGSEQADAMVAWMAFGKEMNPYFMAHAQVLRPVMLSVYLQWQAANALESAPNEDRISKSFVLRAGIFGLIHVVAFLCGGHTHAKGIAVEIYDTYAETAADILQEVS